MAEDSGWRFYFFFSLGKAGYGFYDTFNVNAEGFRYISLVSRRVFEMEPVRCQFLKKSYPSLLVIHLPSVMHEYCLFDVPSQRSLGSLLDVS